MNRNRLRFGQAASAEGDFRSDPNAAWAEPPPPSNYPVDTDDAMVIEHAVCSLSMLFHSVLRYSFVDQLRDGHICRTVERLFPGKQVHPRRDLPAIMEAAVRALTAQLALPAVVRKAHAKQRVVSIREQLGLDKQDDAA